MTHFLLGSQGAKKRLLHISDKLIVGVDVSYFTGIANESFTYFRCVELQLIKTEINASFVG